MKRSIIITIIILILTASLAWRNENKLQRTQQEFQTIQEQASELGISINDELVNSTSKQVSQNRANDKLTQEVDLKKLLEEFLVFAKSAEKDEQSGKQPDQAVFKTLFGLMEKVSALSDAQIQTFLTEVKANQEIKNETKQGLIMFSLMNLVNEKPKQALALFEKVPDMMEGHMKEMFLTNAITQWAKTDSKAALEWMQKNNGQNAKMVNKATKQALITGVAESDPKYALQLGKELQLPVENTISTIMNAAKTSEQKTESLKVLREFSATITDDDKKKGIMQKGLSALVLKQLSNDENFDSTTQWIKSAKLTPDEVAMATENIVFQISDRDSGKWVNWLSTESGLSEERANKRIEDLFERWTKRDYQAAGKWLTDAKDGSAKQTAISTYAKTVYPYDPENAMQWTQTLPEGKLKQDTLKNIYDEMPRSSDSEKQAAEAFARDHHVQVKK